MASMQFFYLARAADAARAAEGATLTNVRERFHASALSWTALADRAGRVDMMRADLLAEKRAERAAAILAG